MGDSLAYNPLQVAADGLVLPTNIAVGAYGGTGCGDAVTNYPTLGRPFYNSRRMRNAFTLNCGVNDYTHGDTTASVYANLLAVVALAKADGFTVAVSTLAAAQRFTDPTGYAWRADLNSKITGGAVANGYVVWDVGADASVGCDTCWQNATYFSQEPDVVHFTTAGTAVQAGYLTTALQALGFQ